MVAAAQVSIVKPDYKAIGKAISDKSSPEYYPKLMERFQVRDTTLTDADIRHLYYGSILQDTYNPFSRNPKEKELQGYYRKDVLSEDDQKSLLELGRESLKKFPMDLRLMNFMAYCYHLQGNNEMAMKTSSLLQHIFGVILSSGDGKTCDTGFHVATVSDQYVLLNMLEMETTGQSLVDHCDYMSLPKGKYKVDGIYFDITMILQKENEAFGK